tara:strand:+ start:3092 stop:3472 length:381 start_codon:yes stop_codon:yes gene_type:complete
MELTAYTAIEQNKTQKMQNRGMLIEPNHCGKNADMTYGSQMDIHCDRVTYQDKKTAKKSARALKAMSMGMYGSVKTYTPYKCKECGQWHLTTGTSDKQARSKKQHARGGRKNFRKKSTRSRKSRRR